MQPYQNHTEWQLQSDSERCKQHKHFSDMFLNSLFVEFNWSRKKTISPKLNEKPNNVSKISKYCPDKELIILGKKPGKYTLAAISNPSAKRHFP